MGHTPKVKCKCSACNKDTFKSNLKKDNFGNYKLYCNDCYKAIIDTKSEIAIKSEISVIGKIKSKITTKRINKSTNIDIDVSNITNSSSTCLGECSRWFQKIWKKIRKCCLKLEYQFKEFNNTSNNTSSAPPSTKKFHEMSEEKIAGQVPPSDNLENKTSDQTDNPCATPI